MDTKKKQSKTIENVLLVKLQKNKVNHPATLHSMVLAHLLVLETGK